MNLKDYSGLYIASYAVGIVSISFSSIFIAWCDAPPAVIGMYRLLFTVIFLLPLVVRQRHYIRKIGTQSWVWLITSGIFLGLHFLFWIGSLKETSIASSMIITALEPLFVMLLSWLIFRERLSWRTRLAMGVALSGMIVIAWSDLGKGGHSVYGDLLALFGTLAVAGYMVAGKHVSKTVPPILYNAIVFLVAGMMLALVSLLQSENMVQFSLRDWTMFLLLAILPTLLGHALFNWLLHHMSATAVSMSVIGEPVGAMLLAWWLLKEPVTGIQGIGALLCIAGVYLYLRQNRKRTEKASPRLSL